MKVRNVFLILFVLLVFVAVSPCSAYENSSDQSLKIEGHFPLSGTLNAGPSDFLAEGYFIEGKNPDHEYNRVPHLVLAAELDEKEEEDLDYLEEEEEDLIPDPLEPLNRASFYFNDKLYFWFLKPVATGYSTFVPEGVRIAVRNVFRNIASPVRIVNNLLQFKFKSAGNELVRFGANSTFGVLGLVDFAEKEMGIKMQDEDFGQTLGKWGLGPVFYINWPVLGPSSVRDSLGLAGDYFLDPVSYVNPSFDRFAIKSGDLVNKASLSIGQYEDLKKDTFDPYIAVRDVYYQYRKSKISR
jgi:phospholipid-binding lipoprotein MlaA